MTTEIAVSNRLGIALATDSAVTITGGGRVKVFDTADKLFELSSEYPIGVMINGNMDCLGVPWEILVKDFRAREGSNSRTTVERWAKDFLSYVETHELISEDASGGYVDRVITHEISVVQNSVMAVVAMHIFENSRATSKDYVLAKGDIQIRKVLAAAIERRSKKLQGFPIAQTLTEINKDELRERYAARVKGHLHDAFKGQELTDAEIATLTDLVIDALLRAVASDFAAGIVVAGYGTEETFPAVFAAEIDGRVSGKLKITSMKATSIASSEDGGEVTSFAQTDVIERLLKGVDPRFIGSTADFIERAVVQVATAVEESTRGKKMSKKMLTQRKRSIKEVAETVKAEYIDQTAETLKNGFSKEFDRMVAMMPKAELIELAEALVSITAVERKASADEGTVGGPIDVAFITKHEGFVWIKRKHYFQAETNPRYFWRKYGNPPKRSDAS